MNIALSAVNVLPFCHTLDGILLRFVSRGIVLSIERWCTAQQSGADALASPRRRRDLRRGLARHKLELP